MPPSLNPNSQTPGSGSNAPTLNTDSPLQTPGSGSNAPTSNADVNALAAPPHRGYRGRIAPTPTGLLHLGHARTFRIAWQRARAAGGTLVYRQEDLDPLRCTPAFAQAAITDLRRYGLDWDEGPDCTPQGPHAPYRQSERTALYRSVLARLIRSGHAYPSPHSRSDLARAAASGIARPAPPQFGEQDGEAIFPPQWRPDNDNWFNNAPHREQIARSIESHTTPTGLLADSTKPPVALATGSATPLGIVPNNSTPLGIAAGSATPLDTAADSATQLPPATDTAAAIPGVVANPAAALPAVPCATNGVNWRFRVPDGETLRFADGGFGEQAFTAGTDFSDFVLWRRDGVPAYELAVVADDIAMGITEVVRGADLLRSTARQLLLYRALGATPPAFCHCPLVLDPQTGNRLAKRADSLSLRALLDSGWQDDYTSDC